MTLPPSGKRFRSPLLPRLVRGPPGGSLAPEHVGTCPAQIGVQWINGLNHPVGNSQDLSHREEGFQFRPGTLFEFDQGASGDIRPLGHQFLGQAQDDTPIAQVRPKLFGLSIHKPLT